MSSPAQLLAASSLPAVEAEALLLFCLQQTRTWLFLNRDRLLSERECACFLALCQRRLAGEPIAYLTGSRGFWSIDLLVDERVLIPRSDTETLVEWALECQQTRPAKTILDLGTGSGAVALALAQSLPQCKVTAVDASDAALQVAGLNAERLGLSLELVKSDWFSALGQRRWPLVVSNPPYIAPDDPHLSQGDLPAEPRSALVAEENGLACLRQIVTTAPSYLEPGGWLLLEHGYDQATEVRALLNARGFAEVATRVDLGGQPRVSGGRWL